MKRPLSSFLVLLIAAAALADPASSHPSGADPVVITVDVTDAPQLAPLGEKAKAVAEVWYPKIVAVLPGDGFTAPDHVTIIFRNDYDGVAATSDDRVVCSVKYFTTHQDDLGAFVHELTHVVQHYPDANNPGWLAEGIADYIRFYQYEPEANRPHPDPTKANYFDSYRTSAHFLDWAQRTFDPKLVATLNEACRTGKYSDELWKQRTGKTLEQLDAAWKASLTYSTHS